MDKPTKPSNLIPRSFGGVKNNFSSSLQSSGYEDGVPAIYGGDNLNYQLDATGKELDYCEKICDYINAIPINKTPIVDANNKLVYTQYDIKVYNSTDTYGENELVTGIVDGKKHIYRSKQNNNVGQSLTDDTYWEQTDIIGGVKTIGRNIGEIVPSTIPLTDAGLHLLDGALINGSGSYSAFVDYIADLYLKNPSANYFAQPQVSTETTFTQPTLTADGTLGGNDFAVAADSVFGSNSAYKAFIGEYWQGQAGASVHWLTFYNPKPLKVTKVQWYNNTSNNYQITAGTFQASFNGTDWVDLEEIPSDVTVGGLRVLNISTPNFYNYYRFYITGWVSTTALMRDVQITGSYIDGLSMTAEQWWQQQVATYGVCGKFVYNSVNNTVRLPKYNSKIYTGGGTASVVGNGKTVGFTDGISGYGFMSRPMSSEAVTSLNSAYYGTDVGTPATYQTVNISKTLGLSPDSSKSGIIADLANITTALDGYWYIVLATTAKTDIQVDIDEIATDLNGKADTDLSNVPTSKGILTESYVNGTSWYRIYSDGWCEQGGLFTISTTSGNVSLLKNYKDTNYSVFTQAYRSANYYSYETSVLNKTTSSFDWVIDMYTDYIGNFWEAKGYIA